MSSDKDREFDVNQDYYAILGVSKDAPIEEIKKAHVKLALENHPDMLALEDRGNTFVNDGGEKFRRISEAWNVLSRPTVRKAYDAARVGSGALVVVPSTSISMRAPLPHRKHITTMRLRQQLCQTGGKCKISTRQPSGAI